MKASTSEGVFWECINAAGVLRVMVISIWDDDYGISVPAKCQTTKNPSRLSALAAKEKDTNGYNVRRQGLGLCRAN